MSAGIGVEGTTKRGGAGTIEERPAIAGRRSELFALDAALDAAASGRPTSLALTGEPGIGKTELLCELRRRATRRGFAVAGGTAVESERETPLVLLGDALSDALACGHAHGLARLEERRLMELAAVFRAPSGDGSGRRRSASEEIRRPHAAVASALRMLVAARPLVVTLDDLHWADAASLDVIGRLLADPSPPAFVLALAYRPVLLPPGVAGAMAAAVRGGRLTELPLAPLEPSEAAELLGPGVAAPCRARILEDGGGNPFSMLELARAGVSEDLPRGIANTVRAEVERLPELVRTVLRVAATLGEPTEPSVVAEVVGRREVHAPLATLVDLELLTAEGAPATYRFRQPVVRRAVVTLTPATEATRMNAAAAAALERRGEPLAARALHVSRAAAPGDEAAIALLTEAGERCMRRAPAEAAHWFAAANRLLPADAGDRRLHLLRRLAGALMSAGRLEDGRAAFLAAIDGLGEEQAVVRARLIGHLAQIEHMRGQPEAARALLERALAELPESEPESACALRIEFAVDHWPSREWAGMAATASEAYEQARRLGHRAMEFESAVMLATGEYFGLALEPAQRALDRAAAMLRRLPDDALAPVVRSTLYMGVVSWGLERQGDAVHVLTRGLAVATGTGQEFWRAGLLHCLTLAELERGLLRSAAVHADEAVAAATALGVAQQMVWAHCGRGWVSLLQGDARSAMASAERAGEALKRAPDSIQAGLAACIMGAALAESGHPERAVAVIVGQAGGPELSTLTPSSRSQWYQVLVRAELAQGHLEEAEGWLRRAEPLVERLPLPGRVGGLRLAQAEVRFARGNPQRAAILAAAAAQDLRAAGKMIDAARADIETARALEAVGRTSDARRRLVHACEELAACGAEGLRRKGERALRALDETPSGEGVLAGLTSRQREVALLVATGITNGEVAERLGLSGRTVERHVTRILNRLGLSSRAALAAAVERGRHTAASS